MAQETDSRYERLALRNFYSELMELRDRQRAARQTHEYVVSGDDLPWELNPQGFMRWYMAPSMDDIALQTLIMYVQKIPARSRSGRQRTQGHQLGFVWQGGSGYSIINEARYEWSKWDLIQIPLPPEGCIVQHFNSSDEEVQIIFCSPNTVHSGFVDRGVGFEQIEECPEYRDSRISDG